MSDPDKKPRNKKKIIIYSIIGGMIFLGMLLSKMKKQEAPVLNEDKPTPVSISTIAPSDINDQMIVPGTLDPWYESVLSAEQAGKIIVIAAEKGSRVKKGDLLLSIDSTFQELALKRAEIAKADAESDFERWTKLQKTGSVSDEQMEKIKHARDFAEVAHAEAVRQLDYCSVKAPEDGVVTDRMVEIGEYVMPGTPVLEIVEDKRLKLVVSIPERDVYAVTKGDKLSFKVPAVTEKEFSGEVSFVAPRGDKASNSFRVEVEVDNSNGELKPGCIASLSLNRAVIKNKIVVPLTSLIPVRGQYVAFVVKGNSASKRVVRIESIMGSEAVVESGVTEGEQLIIEGHRTLEDGMNIKIIE